MDNGLTFINNNPYRLFNTFFLVCHEAFLKENRFLKILIFYNHKDIFFRVQESQDSRQEAAVRALICNCRRFPPSNRIKCKSGGLRGG